METLMTNSYRLFKVMNGRLRFAEVAVGYDPVDLDPSIDLVEKIEANEGIAFVMANWAPASKPIYPTSIQVSILDTGPGDVFCAAALATWHLLGNPGQPPQIIMQTDRSLTIGKDC